jgi:hypothetical protein
MTTPRFITGRKFRIGTALVALTSMLVVPAAVGGEDALAAAPEVARPAAVGPRVITAHAGDNLKALLQSLYPGDTLRLAPGAIFNTGYLSLYGGAVGGIRLGSSAAPITVTSADPSNPARIVGGLMLTRANYWRLSGLQFVATATGKSALYMSGGVGWSVTNSEFWGADRTGSYANVAIGGTATYGSPSRFVFAGNCLHNAGQTSRSNTDQNLYVSFAGSSGTSGGIARNIIWGSPNGSAIKLGNGGSTGELGPWNVAITNNTLISNGRQLMITGNVRNNLIRSNLFVNATAGFTRSPQTTQIYVNGRVGGGNYVDHNYGFGASMFAFDPAHSVRYGKNYQSNSRASNPAFSSGWRCTAWRPTNRPVTLYGRYAPTTW